jgi:hypothetical protein
LPLPEKEQGRAKAKPWLTEKTGRTRKATREDVREPKGMRREERTAPWLAEKTGGDRKANREDVREPKGMQIER